jgi:tetratricopeptide (TPR) repeat protein
LLALAGPVLAAGTDDQYLDIYNQILQAESLQQGGHSDTAAVKFRDAQAALQKLHDDHPAWNATVVDFRLSYLAEKLAALAQFLPATNAPAPLNPPPAAVVAATNATPQQQAAGWEAQARALDAANVELRQKLKEALSVQPAAVAPGELAKEEERNLLLQKERDLLNVALEQQKAAQSRAAQPSPSGTNSSKLADEVAALKARSAEEAKQARAESADLKRKLEESQKKLADTSAELTSLKSRPPAEHPPAENVKQLTIERDKLKKELAAVSKELADREAHPEAPPAAPPSGDAIKLKQVEQERDDLARQVAALSRPAPNPAQTAPAGSSAEIGQLRARLTVLEAAAVPYTAEELAVLKAAPSSPPAAPPVATKPTKHTAHSVKDLPTGAGPLMAEAKEAAARRDYDTAEKNYLEVLRQDEDNVYVLVNLGNAEFANGHVDDCEKNVRHALTLDPDDPGALYLLGILRYRQERLDEAMDALSRSASLNATNASTQNYLGCVLSDKGLRPAAETAFRKALALDPLYADAHYNLAFVYATEKPPFLALARLHYQNAVDLGHPKNSSLDKILAGGK